MRIKIIISILLSAVFVLSGCVNNVSNKTDEKKKNPFEDKQYMLDYIVGKKDISSCSDFKDDYWTQLCLSKICDIVIKDGSDKPLADRCLANKQNPF